MTNDDVLGLFTKTGALLEGHFVYASGRHGRQFLQAARVAQYPEYTEALCRAMASPFQDENIAVVCGPATGGIVLAYETARHLNARAVFAEKEPDGGMAVKRGLHIQKGARILVVEDVITTGGSVAKTISHLRDRGADVAGVAAFVDRGGKAAFDCAYAPLARLVMESWSADECPLCAQGVPVTEPDDLQA
jgi:orotate phosphoribosyltransferase